MKFALLSDLHLEFTGHDGQFPKADVLLLAGDIGARYTKGLFRYEKFIKSANAFYNDSVVEIDGNHTGYGGHIRHFTNVRHSLHFDEGVSVIACTLWSGQNSQFAYTQLNDKHIGGFTWDWMHDNHEKDVEHLEEEMAYARSLGNKIVVMTHHMPHVNCVAEKWGAKMHADSPLNAPFDINLGFYTDLDWLIKKYNPEVWCSGHTHDSYDFMEGKTRMLCNPRGYPIGSGDFENPDFNPMLTFEV